MTLTLLEFAQRCLSDIDYEYVTLFDIIKGESASFSTYPDAWCARYLSEKYYENDYVHLKSLYLPLIWGENESKNVSQLQRRIFKEAQDFHIYKGITVPFLFSDSREFITLALNKKEKLSKNKLIHLTTQIHWICHLIFTYKHILENNVDPKEHALQFIEEVMNWQKNSLKQKDKHKEFVTEILSDIRASQMFIAHHETKELGLETLQRTYKDVEKLI
jgi:hypothetical protein